MGLIANRNTPRRSGDIVTRPVAANKKIFAGALVARDALGNATPGATATTLKGLGRARGLADNTGGAAGDISVEVEKGIFRFANSATDACSAADIGNDCYIVDDQTVSKTNAGNNTQSVAGKIFDVDAEGVWVDFR